MEHKNKLEKRGVSLLEFIAVIAIIVILFSVIAPAISRVRDNSRTVVCLSNIKQISLAVLQYSLDNEHLPDSMYDPSVAVYYGEDMGLVICPADERSLGALTTPRGSYGLHKYASNFSDAAQNVPLIADASAEDLTISSFRTRHKENKKGNVAFLDGHVENISKNDFSLIP